MQYVSKIVLLLSGHYYMKLDNQVKYKNIHFKIFKIYQHFNI